jgi:hypothetical protein
MSLSALVDINFADPVLSLDLNGSGLVYGTALGRIVYYDFETNESLLIAERSEEPIRGVSIDEQGTLYVAIGDLKGLIMSSPESQYSYQHDISHEQPHTPVFCTSTQVLMHRDSICLMHPESEQDLVTLVARPTVSALHITQLSTQRRNSYGTVKFTSLSVPFDFDGNRLLWLECQHDQSKSLNVFSFMTERFSPVMQVPGKTRITYAKLIEDYLVLIEDCRTVKAVQIGASSAPIVFGSTGSDIMAACCDQQIQLVNLN